jgi:hypothetical protein
VRRVRGHLAAVIVAGVLGLLGGVAGLGAVCAGARLCCGLRPGDGFLTPHWGESLIAGYSHDRPEKGVVMSDFLADVQSYFASEQEAREAELAEAGPAFEPAEYASRLGRLRQAMSEAGVDVVLLSRPESMCWLHGYTARWYRHGGPPE